MVSILTTPRLVLRPLELADAGHIQELFPCWEIVRFMASHIPWPYPPDGALTFIRDVALPAVAAGTEWHWTLRRLERSPRTFGRSRGTSGEPGLEPRPRR